MKKICLVATVPFVFTHHLRHHILALSSKGYQVHLVSSSSSDFYTGKFDTSSLENVYFHELKIARKFSVISDVIALFRLFYYSYKNKFDVVHSITSKAGFIAALAGFFAGIPIRLHTFIGQPWIVLSGLKKQIPKFCDKLILTLNTQCYADSFSQKELLILEIGKIAEKVKVIGHGSLAGVDFSKFCKNGDFLDIKRDLEILNEIVITFIGRLTKDKGLEELIEAFIKLEVLTCQSLRLILVGPFEEGSSEFNNKIKNLAASCKSIDLVGYTNNPEAYLSFTDIFCLPSYREGFGTVVLEAAAMGVPAVVTRVVGLVDAVIENETGIFCMPKDSNDLTRALLSLVENPGKRFSMGLEAKNRAFKLFNSTKVIDEFTNEYDRLICQK